MKPSADPYDIFKAYALIPIGADGNHLRSVFMALMRHSFHGSDEDFQRTRTAYDERTAGGTHYLAQFDGGTVGGLTLGRIGARECLPGNLAVAPDRRGQGHGKAIVRKAESLARQFGYHAICLWAGGANGPFYAGCGYVADQGYANGEAVCKTGFPIKLFSRPPGRPGGI